MFIDMNAVRQALLDGPNRRARNDPGRYLALAEAALEHADSTGRLDDAALRRLEQATWDRERGPRRSHRERLRYVLASLNAAGLLDAVLPKEKVLRPRPAALPVSPQQARQQETAQTMDRYLDAWLKTHTDEIAKLLGFAVRLVTRAGLSERVVVGVLARLRWQDVAADGTLALPIDPLDYSDTRYRLRPPTGCRKLLRRERRRKACAETGVFAAILGEPPREEKAMRAHLQTVREKLDELFRVFAADFARDHKPNVELPAIKRWRPFAHAAYSLPLRRGVPPVFLDILSQFPLPASSASVAFLATAAHTPPGERYRRSLPKAAHGARSTDNAELLRTPGPVVLTSQPLPEDWTRWFENQLSAFIHRAEALSTQSGRIGSRSHKALIAARDALLDRADTVMPSASLLHVALGWGLKKLLFDEIKITSLRSYYSRIFRNALLLREETSDLTEWDDETVQELTGEVIASQHWSKQTEQQYLATWSEFLRYAQSVGLLQEVENPIRGGERIHRATRTEILTPYEFDYAWKLLTHDTSRHQNAQLAVALALGFYGGMRASEVVGLTLQDVYIAGGEVWVYIRAGKTPAARRKIGLHAVAPPDVLTHVCQWVARRRAEFGRIELKSVGLFGPEHEAASYNRRGLIDPLLAWLREIFGEGVDFHLLRHSTASWLLLRLYCAQHPSFRAQLHHRHHWMFSKEALLTCARLLSGPRATPEAPGCDQWLYVAKFIGHRDLGTLLLHYTHTLGPIHSDVLERAWAGRPKAKQR